MSSGPAASSEPVTSRASSALDAPDLRPEIRLLSATFSDKATENRFVNHLIEEGFRREKFMQALGTFVFIAYGVLDALVVGDLAKEFLIVRFVIAAPIAFGIICLSWLKPFKRLFGLATSLALMIYALAIVYMIYRMPGMDAPPYIIGVLVVLIFTSCLMRINFIFAGPTYTVIAALYCIALAAKGDATYEAIVSGYFFMISVTCVAIVTIYLQERRARETWIAGEYRAHDNAVIRQLLLEATAADRSKTNFLSIVTHELRTPLHQIIGYSEVVRKQPDLKEAPQYLDQVIGSANDLLKKLGKMLRYADAAAGKLKVELEECSILDIVDRVREEGRKAASGSSITITANDVADAMLWVDPHHTAYAMQNIVENAISASKPGSTISIKGRKISDTEYAIHIVDSGEGMRPDQIEDAFKPFAQSEAGLSRYREGLGLGLPIANRLLNEQNARLTIHSEIGAGTDVKIVFQLREEKTQPHDMVEIAS